MSFSALFFSQLRLMRPLADLIMSSTIDLTAWAAMTSVKSEVDIDKSTVASLDSKDLRGGISGFFPPIEVNISQSTTI